MTWQNSNFGEFNCSERKYGNNQWKHVIRKQTRLWLSSYQPLIVGWLFALLVLYTFSNETIKTWSFLISSLQCESRVTEGHAHYVTFLFRAPRKPLIYWENEVSYCRITCFRRMLFKCFFPWALNQVGLFLFLVNVVDIIHYIDLNNCREDPGSGNLITFAQFLVIAVEGFITTMRFGTKKTQVPFT